MADTITSTSTFEVGLEFEDNDGRTQKATIKIPNPKSDINLRQSITNALTAYSSSIGFYDNNESYHGVDSDMIVTGSTTDETVRIIDIGVAD